jgi:hypothetical protein
MQPANSPFWSNLFDLQIENQLIHTPNNLPKKILGQKKKSLLLISQEEILTFFFPLVCLSLY